MECSIKFSTKIVFNGSVWHIVINDTKLNTAFKRQKDADLIARFLQHNSQNLCDAISKEMEK